MGGLVANASRISTKVSFRTVVRAKTPMLAGEPMVVRDGRKIRLFYHEHCFSGTADPRTQVHSSFNQGKFTNINPVAPRVKGYGKWAGRFLKFELTRAYFVRSLELWLQRRLNTNVLFLV